MRCEEWGDVLTDWVLDELSPSLAEELKRHLEQCPECAGRALRLRGVRQALTGSLTDRDLPAHILFLPETRQKAFAGFWTALFRSAAYSAVAAVIFLAVVSLSFQHGGTRLFARPGLQPALTRAEVQELVDHAVARQATLQNDANQAATQAVAASLRQEHSVELARLARQLQYLEMAQNTVWKETQRQYEVLSLVAHSQQSPSSLPEAPAPR